MAARLSGPELRKKLERYVRRMSKWVWVWRILTLVLMGLFLMDFWAERHGRAVLSLFLFLLNFVLVIRHDLVVLMLRLLPQQDETQG